MTLEKYRAADELARAAMAIRPDLKQGMSLDDWLAEYAEQLTEREKAVAYAALNYHPDNNPDFD